MKSTIASLIMVPLLHAKPSQVATSVQPIKVEICDIARHPERFVGKHVVFHAEILADGMHGALLKDHEEKCFVNFARPSVRESAAEQEASTALEKAIFQGHPGTVDKRIEGDFGGLLLMELPDFGPATRTKRPSLRLESLDNLKVAEFSVDPK